MGFGLFLPRQQRQHRDARLGPRAAPSAVPPRNLLTQQRRREKKSLRL